MWIVGTSDFKFNLWEKALFRKKFSDMYFWIQWTDIKQADKSWLRDSVTGYYNN